jgi:DNA-binding CsgD family transcriptional regulator
MQINLTYFIRDKHGKKTDTTAPITIELIKSKVTYREVISAKRAICLLMRRQGRTRREIADYFDMHPDEVTNHISKVDFKIVDKIEL